MAAERRWALILGCSSGFGAAACRAYAREGYGIVGVHLDRRGAMPAVEALRSELEGFGGPVHFVNQNAAADDTRAGVIELLGQVGSPGGVAVLLHSLAFGTLRPFVPNGEERAVARRQIDMTLDVMAHSSCTGPRTSLRRGSWVSAHVCSR